MEIKKFKGLLTNSIETDATVTIQDLSRQLVTIEFNCASGKLGLINLNPDDASATDVKFVSPGGVQKMFISKIYYEPATGDKPGNVYCKGTATNQMQQDEDSFDRSIVRWDF